MHGISAHDQVDEAVPRSLTVGDGRNRGLIGMTMIEADDGTPTRGCRIVGFDQRCGIKHVTVARVEDVRPRYDAIDEDRSSPYAYQDAAYLAFGLFERMVL
jgi:hypothetical protein